jgi:Protein of unknown function (DUF993)
MNAPERLTNTIALPAANGALETHRMSVPRNFPTTAQGAFTRIAYSAAHVVADPRKAHDPWLDCAIDWDATINFRRHVWQLGWTGRRRLS